MESRSTNQPLVIPVRVTAEGIVADALVTIHPGHPDYVAWREYFDVHPDEEEAYREAFEEQSP